MDADEILSSRDHRRMKKLLRRHREADTAFSITTRNYTFLCNLMDWIANDGAYPEEAGTGWTPSEKVRLFPNRPNIRFEYPVHEVVRPSLDREGIKIKKCPVPVHHYGQLDQVKAAQKGAAYYNIGIKKIDAMAQDPQAIQELAAQAMLLGRQEEAVDLWQRLSMLEPDNAHAYVNLATAYDRLGNHTNARSAAIRAADLDKGLKEAHFNAARAELHLGRASEAAARLKPLVLKHRHYYAAEFMLGCARICAGEMREGINIIAKLKSTSLWHTIVYAFQEIAQSLLNAERTAFSRKIYRAASNLGLSIETATDPAEPAPALFVAAQIEG